MATEIQSAAINKVYDKRGRTLGYLVASDSDQGAYHQVTWSQDRLRWVCSGEHCKLHVSCKHTRAVSEVLKLQRQERQARDAEIARMHREVAPVVDEAAERRAIAPLNGNRSVTRDPVRAIPMR